VQVNIIQVHNAHKFQVPYVKRLLMAEVLEEKNVKIMFDAARVG
jgi:hypothetical protein